MERISFDGNTADRALYSDIAEFIYREDSGSFESLVLRLFERQYRLNAPYRTFCESCGIDPNSITHWTHIPAIPAKAFKLADLSCSPIENASVVFHSSGTIERNHSKHFMDTAAKHLYTKSLQSGFEKFVTGSLEIVALMPSPEHAPNSSLSHMLGKLGCGEFHWNDLPKLKVRLAQIAADGKPVCVFGTAFSFIELFDSTDQSWRLPAGSKVIETGGFKGRTREITRHELYDLFSSRFGVVRENIIAEYGMSEMASQFYNIGSTGFQAPHWLRYRIIDPITLDDTDTGLLRVYDLANWNSVAVIQTQDMVARLPNDRFELLGRASDAELRGCSLMVEERWFSEHRG